MLKKWNTAIVKVNPYLLFSPFLVIYIVFILVKSQNFLIGDEFRYVAFAQNLLHGFYSPSDEVDLACGPGYPLLLTPFYALHIPTIVIKLFNAGFQYLSIIFVFKSLRIVVSPRKAIFFSFYWACYYISFVTMPFILTETLTMFLVALLIFLLLRALNPAETRGRKYTVLAGLCMGYIALTKVIFGYVIVCLLLCSLFLWLLDRKNWNYRRGLVILAISFATTVPYLAYTYSVSGRMFYWSTLGGNNMYWMSSPYKNEYGNWFPDIDARFDSMSVNDRIVEKRDFQNHLAESFYMPGGVDSIKAHHRADFAEVDKLKGVDKDDAYRDITMRNIRKAPWKYLQNCFSNIGRMLFDYPVSYLPQTPGLLFRLPANGILLVLVLFSIIPTLWNWRK
ncbi:MAG TPA: glycosyltransferase family 39 protein, partial [Chitinophagaceae bacterium]